MTSPDAIVTGSRFESPQEYGEAIFVVGLQHGDEGKGKIVDMLAEDVDAVARGNGGSNAGHTLVVNGAPLALHQIPSGIVHPETCNILGHGMLVDPVRLDLEMLDVRAAGLSTTPEKIAISGMAHVVTPRHKALDAARESGKGAQGSTKAGIAYAASDKALREGLRAESFAALNRSELFDYAYEGLRTAKAHGFFGVQRRIISRLEAQEQATEFARASKKLAPYIRDTPGLLNDILTGGGNVLIEGAQAFGLDINHGKYPTTTSTGTTVPALIEGTGINPKHAGKVVGVAKATPSKVGGGAFVTRIEDADIARNTRGNKGEVDGEYGATTGREREVGFLDLVLLKRAVLINGVDEIALTKFDCIHRHGEYTKIAIAYDLTNVDGSVTRLYTPPTSNDELLRCKPVYKTLPTWEDDNSKEAEEYLRTIEEYLGVPVTIVSNGPKREDYIVRSTQP